MRLINMQIQWKKQVILIDKFLFKHSGTWCRSVSLNSLANWAKSSFSTNVLFDLNGGPCIQELEHPLFQPLAMD